MINFRSNLNFGSLNNSRYIPNGTMKNSCVNGDTFEASRKKEKLVLPKKVSPYSQRISQMDDYINKTEQYVDSIRERAAKRANYVNKLYHSMQHGVCYKNIIRRDKKINGSEYSTLIIEDLNGDISKIAHLKNGEIQVVYDVLTTLRPNDDINSEKGMKANCYTYQEGRCVEYSANIKNKVKDFMADSEYELEYQQWPCRNQDGAPVSHIIGFKENGGYQYYENYIIDMIGGYKASVVNRVNEDGSNSITCNQGDGLVYTINNDTKGRRPIEHMLIVKAPLPSIDIW